MKNLKHRITDEIFIVDAHPILYIEDINSLVIADLHLGIESIMAEEGAVSPVKQTDRVIKTIQFYLENLKPSKIIINGDLKHSFKEPSKIENRDVKKFIDEVSTKVSQVHIVKGNHDLFLSWALQNFDNVKLHEEHYQLDRYFFVHGDKQLPENIPKEIEFIIIGHEHPVLEARIRTLEKVRAQRFYLVLLLNQIRRF